MTFLTGKLPYRHDARTLRARHILRPLTVAPSTLDWNRPGYVKGMMANDRYGDCVVAAAAHQVQLWTGNAAGKPVTISDQAIIDKYFGLTGGEDSGLVMLDFLKDWKTNGLASHRIDGYALVNANDPVELRQCALVFGGLYLGLSLPVAWQSDTVWDTGSGYAYEPGGWGGHAISMIAAEKNGNAKVFTWGYEQEVTWRALARYCDEAWCVASPDWAGGAPAGFDREALDSRLAAL